MSIPLVLWIVIALALAIIYVYRRIVSGSSDELVHLSDVSDAVLEKQEATASKIQQLDRIVLILTIVFVVYGLALGGLQIYQAFSSPSPSA
jgi:preprotein translocase subunit SecG